MLSKADAFEAFRKVRADPDHAHNFAYVWGDVVVSGGFATSILIAKFTGQAVGESLLAQRLNMHTVRRT